MARDNSAQKQIRNLLSVLGVAVACAITLCVLLIYFYGPTGRYTTRDALLQPDLVTGLAYNDTDKKVGGLVRYVYDGLTITFYDAETKAIKTLPISPEKYREIYALIANDSSLLAMQDDLVTLFNKGPTATVAILVHTENQSPRVKQNKEFQSVEFAGDFYRIKLHEETNPNMWVYYHHEGIFKQVMQLITKK